MAEFAKKLLDDEFAFASRLTTFDAVGVLELFRVRTGVVVGDATAMSAFADEMLVTVPDPLPPVERSTSNALVIASAGTFTISGTMASPLTSSTN